MKRLIPRRSAKNYPSCSFEKPFFAVAEVERALFSPYDLPGLHDLIHECGSSSVDCLREYPRRAILQKVRDGDWLLACSRPFSPFTPKDAVCWPVLPPGGGDRIEGKVKNESSQVDVPASQQVVSVGPGKWVLKDIDHDALWNAFTIVANRSGTIVNEGSVIFSEGKDWANTKRTLTHVWVRLGADEGNFEAGSAIYRYGDSKKTIQKYVESSDHWAVTGQSWHWIPATPNVIFERRE